jgi:hypothetical protein
MPALLAPDALLGLVACGDERLKGCDPVANRGLNCVG